MSDFLTFGGGFIAVIVGLSGAIVALTNWGQEVQCRNTAAQMGLRYSYSLTTPCMVEWKGQFLPLDAIRAVN